MTAVEKGLTLVPGDYIVRCAWEDRHPVGADIQQKARDSVIRYADHYGLAFRWVHDQYGERWKDGVPERVYGWRSEAVVTAVGLRPARHGCKVAYDDGGTSLPPHCDRTTGGEVRWI